MIIISNPKMEALMTGLFFLRAEVYHNPHAMAAAISRKNTKVPTLNEQCKELTKNTSNALEILTTPGMMPQSTMASNITEITPDHIKPLVVVFFHFLKYTT